MSIRNKQLLGTVCREIPGGRSDHVAVLEFAHVGAAGCGLDPPRHRPPIPVNQDGIAIGDQPLLEVNPQVVAARAPEAPSHQPLVVDHRFKDEPDAVGLVLLIEQEVAKTRRQDRRPAVDTFDRHHRLSHMGSVPPHNVGSPPRKIPGYRVEDGIGSGPLVGSAVDTDDHHVGVRSGFGHRRSNSVAVPCRDAGAGPRGEALRAHVNGQHGNPGPL